MSMHLVDSVSHNQSAIQHSLASIAVGGLWSAFILHYLPTISLILSTIAATLSILTMIIGGFSSWNEHRAKLRAAEIEAKAKLEAEGLKQQAKVVAAAIKEAAKVD